MIFHVNHFQKCCKHLKNEATTKKSAQFEEEKHFILTTMCQNFV